MAKLKYIKPLRILFIKDEETKEKIQMLNRFNPHVCESFFADEVVLVEGDTEAIILRELFLKHHPEKEIFILNTGSKNNMPFFINVLGSFKIRQHIIHDSDERFLYKNGAVIKNENGNNRANSAWTMNRTIWDAMEAAKERNSCYVRRYVSIRNFEHAHNYKHDPKKGKPLSAFEYARNININDNTISIVSQIKKIVGDIDNDTDFNQEYLEQNVREPV